ncbi:MAG TPA: glycerate kinase [Actinomycetota bacterium]
MRVLVAPDKFKGTLTASQAAEAIAAGWRRGDPHAEIEVVPVADGGEGTLETLVEALGGELHRARVSGPLGDPVDAAYGLVPTPTGAEGVIEMARASGLDLVSEGRRDVKRASTRGTGELMREACARGAKRLLVCIGGSATNDAGAGMAQALGIRLLDERGRDLAPGGAALLRLALIDLRGLDPRVAEAEVAVACDVDNPLTGPRGASAVYGPQKGATPEDVALLDGALAHFGAVVLRDLGVDLGEVPGAGAAGGLGAGLVAFLGARLRPGFDLVADAVGLGERVMKADVVVTGEGRYDEQSTFGKAPGGVLRLAREAGKPTVLIAGQIADGLEAPADVVESLEARVGLEAARSRAREALTDAATDAAARLDG